MSTQEPTARPWLADREHFAETALYVHAAMTEAECQAPTMNSGLDLSVARTESSRLLLWCAGEVTGAGIAGAFRRVSQACREGRRRGMALMLDPTKAFACFDPEDENEPHADWLIGDAEVGRRFVSLEFHAAVRVACGAAALARLQRLNEEWLTGRALYRPLGDARVRTKALAVRVEPMLARARAHAQCAATYLAGSPQTVRSNIEESVREHQTPEHARYLLEGCREVARRAPKSLSRRRGP